MREREIDPLELGVPRCDPAELAAARPRRTPARSARVFAGAATAGARDAILLNAAGAIAAGGHAARPARGRSSSRARRSTRAPPAERLEQLVAFSREDGAPREVHATPSRAPGSARSPRSSGARRRRATSGRTPTPASCARRVRARPGAARVSVLVDERFGGSLDDLRAARAATALPLLAKGFFTDERQLAELRGAGADAALLLLRDLDDDGVRGAACARRPSSGSTRSSRRTTRRSSTRAVALGAEPIGINARDLDTFAIDRRAQLELVARAPRDRVVVAESGDHTRAQGAAAELAGADAILVGTALMRAPDPAREARASCSRARS